MRGKIFTLTGRGMKLRPEGLRAGVGILGRAQRAPSPPARGLGSTVSSPNGVPGKFEIWCKTSKFTTEMPYNV